MTLSECLAQIDELKPNTYDDAMKIRWISELDGKIFNDLVKSHVRDKVKPTKNELITSAENEEESPSDNTNTSETEEDELLSPLPNPAVESDDEEAEEETNEPIEEPADETEEEEELVDPPEYFYGYTDEDLAVELIAPFPYDSIYRNYVFALIDYANGEADRYQATMSMFNATYADFCDWYNRTHETIKTPLKIF